MSTFQKIAADAAVKLRSAAARSCAARSVVETVNMMHNSSQNLLETLLANRICQFSCVDEGVNVIEMSTSRWHAVCVAVVLRFEHVLDGIVVVCCLQESFL